MKRWKNAASIPLMTETYSACYDGFTQITPAHRANSRVTVLPNQFIYLALMGLVAGIEEPLARVILALLDGGESFYINGHFENKLQHVLSVYYDDMIQSLVTAPR